MPYIRCAAASLAFSILCAYGWGDASSGGPRQYPQFRSISGLPGGCFAVSAKGEVDMNGALSFSTPIGFSLSRGQYVLAASSMSHDGQLRFGDTSQSDQLEGINGTLVGMAGFGGKWGSATFSYMVLSRIMDHVLNLQYQLPIRSKRVGVSIGVQDLTSEGGSMGQNFEDDGKCSRSVYAAATCQVAPGIFTSMAYGNYRFDGVTGNVSFPLTTNARACVEFDGFDWNVLASYSPTTRIVASVGVVNRQFAFWSLAYKF